MSSNYNANNPGTNGEKMQTGNESSEIQQLLTTVLREQGREQKRKRRFRILWLAALVLLLVGGLVRAGAAYEDGDQHLFLSKNGQWAVPSCMRTSWR